MWGDFTEFFPLLMDAGCTINVACVSLKGHRETLKPIVSKCTLAPPTRNISIVALCL